MFYTRFFDASEDPPRLTFWWYFGTKWAPKVDFRGLEDDSKKKKNKKSHAGKMEATESDPLAPLKT